MSALNKYKKETFNYIALADDEHKASLDAPTYIPSAEDKELDKA